MRYALAGQDAKAHRHVRLASVAALVVFGGWALLLSIMLKNFAYLSSKTDLWLRLLQFLSPIVFFGAAIVGVWNAWIVVRSKRKVVREGLGGGAGTRSWLSCGLR